MPNLAISRVMVLESPRKTNPRSAAGWAQFLHHLGSVTSRFYVACDFGPDTGRIVLGNLVEDKFVLSEVRRFENKPLQGKEREWDISGLFSEMVEGLRTIGAAQEPIQSISCCSWPGDYILFEGDRTIISPVYQAADDRTRAGFDHVTKRIDPEVLFAETGVQRLPHHTLFQFGAENGRRMRSANHFLPIADSFNYLLSGVPKAEMSLACATQLFDPRHRSWSTQLMDVVKVSSKIFPPLVAPGTRLGPLRPEMAADMKVDDAEVVAGCSDRLACATLGLPINGTERWASLSLGSMVTIGAGNPAPVLTNACRDVGFNNLLTWGGAAFLHKETMGLRVLEECQRQWSQTDGGLDADVLSHLAGSSPAFASLIDPTDPRFLTPGNMVEKIQTFCRETNQTVPRKPGPIFRCILESLALMYRRVFSELEFVTGASLDQLYVLGNQATANALLTHFTCNAVQLPVTIIPQDTVCLGSLVTQALAAGHIKSLDHARLVLRKSLPAKMLVPHGTMWDEAYDRIMSLKAA